MRDSTFKHFLLRGYFSYLEIARSAQGLLNEPKYELVDADYDDYWKLRPLSGVEPRFAIIEKHLDSGSTLLDVGCGDGAMLNFLREVKQIEGLGLDISQVAVDKAIKRGVSARVQRLEDFLSENSTIQFDHVVISEVLEHVSNPEWFVQVGWRLCRKSLWLTFPNIAYFPHRLRMVKGSFPVQWVVFPGEHLRFWSLTDFRNWLCAMEMPPAIFRPSNGLIIFGLHRFWPNLLANQIVVELRKRDNLS